MRNDGGKLIASKPDAVIKYNNEYLLVCDAKFYTSTNIAKK